MNRLLALLIRKLLERMQRTVFLLRVSVGHNRDALKPDLHVQVLKAVNCCDSKILYRGVDGSHQERHLVRGDLKVPLLGTRCFMNLERECPILMEKIAPPHLGRELVERVNLYVSPAKTGSPTHFDICTVLIVQLTGNKLWQVGCEPAVKDPVRNTVADEHEHGTVYGQRRLSLPEEMHFAFLEAGDWLLVPRGTWHATFSHRGSVSASLALRDTGYFESHIERFCEHFPVPPRGKRLLC